MSWRSALCLAFVLASGVGPGIASDVVAQAMAGPIAQSDGQDAAVPKLSKKGHQAKTKVAAIKGKPKQPKPAALEPWAAVDPARVAPPPPPEASLPPIDTKATAAENVTPATGSHPELGMKWNGNNDTATQTRAQNYGGDAEGAGAAMGLKFHF
jgi:hypothetical protein